MFVFFSQVFGLSFEVVSAEMGEVSQEESLLMINVFETDSFIGNAYERDFL